VTPIGSRSQRSASRGDLPNDLLPGRLARPSSPTRGILIRLQGVEKTSGPAEVTLSARRHPLRTSAGERVSSRWLGRSAAQVPTFAQAGRGLTPGEWRDRPRPYSRRGASPSRCRHRPSRTRYSCPAHRLDNVLFFRHARLGFDAFVLCRSSCSRWRPCRIRDPFARAVGGCSALPPSCRACCPTPACC